MHEAAHTDSFHEPHRAAIDAAFDAESMEPPRYLWHVVLFYSVGQSLRDVLEARGIEEYQEYAERNALYTRRRNP